MGQDHSKFDALADTAPELDARVRAYARSLHTGDLVRLRPALPADFEPLTAWFTDPAHRIAHPGGPAGQSPLAVTSWLRDLHHGTDRARLALCITTIDGELVGHAVLTEALPAARVATLEVMIGAPYAAKGYRAEATALMVHLAFAEHGLNKVEASCWEYGHRETAVLTSLGFTHEGTRRCAVFHDGGYTAIVHWGLTAAEHRQHRAADHTVLPTQAPVPAPADAVSAPAGGRPLTAATSPEATTQALEGTSEPQQPTGTVEARNTKEHPKETATNTKVIPEAAPCDIQDVAPTKHTHTSSAPSSSATVVDPWQATGLVLGVHTGPIPVIDQHEDDGNTDDDPTLEQPDPEDDETPEQDPTPQASEHDTAPDSSGAGSATAVITPDTPLAPVRHHHDPLPVAIPADSREATVPAGTTALPITDQPNPSTFTPTPTQPAPERSGLTPGLTARHPTPAAAPVLSPQCGQAVSAEPLHDAAAVSPVELKQRVSELNEQRAALIMAGPGKSRRTDHLKAVQAISEELAAARQELRELTATSDTAPPQPSSRRPQHRTGPGRLSAAVDVRAIAQSSENCPEPSTGLGREVVVDASTSPDCEANPVPTAHHSTGQATSTPTQTAALDSADPPNPVPTAHHSTGQQAGQPLAATWFVVQQRSPIKRAPGSRR